MKNSRPIENDIAQFYELWDPDTLCDFMRDIIELINLYDLDDENDWVRNTVGDDDVQNVRIIRTAYLMSRIAEKHAGKLCRIKSELKGLYKRMEDIKNGKI